MVATSVTMKILVRHVLLERTNQALSVINVLIHVHLVRVQVAVRLVLLGMKNQGVLVMLSLQMDAFNIKIAVENVTMLPMVITEQVKLHIYARIKMQTV